MITYNETLCVSGAELIITDKNPTGLIKKGMWSKWIRGGAKVARRGCFRTPSLIEFNTIPFKYQKLISDKYGIYPKEYIYRTFAERIVIDEKAIEYYKKYVLSNGQHLPEAVQKEYQINASVLNEMQIRFSECLSVRKRGGGGSDGVISNLIKGINSLRAEIKHSLPVNKMAFKRKYKSYIQDGYESLISKKYCNSNSVKKGV